MTRPTEVGVIHGRFQVPHNDHLVYLLAGKERCRHLVVGITNPDPSLTKPDPADPARSNPAANPLTYFERYTMIRAALIEAGLAEGEFSIVPLPINVPELIGHYVPSEATFYLTIYDDWGQAKLKRLEGLGLNCEVMWERPLEEKGVTASRVRRLMIEGGDWPSLVPKAVERLMAARSD